MTDKEIIAKLKALGWGMYNSYQYLTNDTRQIREAMEMWYKFINFELNEEESEEPSIPDIVDEHFWEMLGEEPASKDLEEASKEWLRPQLDKSYANYGEAKMMELTHFNGYAMLNAIEFGANLQKQKMLKILLSL